jgi:hypothetical protein
MGKKESKLARERMTKTGESYAAALSNLRKHDVRAFLVRVIAAAADAFRKAERAEEEASSTGDVFARLFAPKTPLRAALDDELRGATVDALSVLQAVMWVGRDDGPDAAREDVFARLRHARASTSSGREEEAEYYIAEKAPLAEYLTDGMRILAGLSLDVNKL